MSYLKFKLSWLNEEKVIQFFFFFFFSFYFLDSDVLIYILTDMQKALNVVMNGYKGQTCL